MRSVLEELTRRLMCLSSGVAGAVRLPSFAGRRQSTLYSVVCRFDGRNVNLEWLDLRGCRECSMETSGRFRFAPFERVWTRS